VNEVAFGTFWFSTIPYLVYALNLLVSISIVNEKPSLTERIFKGCILFNSDMP
jgi:hypothetical protein